MRDIAIFMCFCVLISCLRETPTNKYQILANTSLTLTHKGQTQLAVEYKQIYISLEESFVQTLHKKYFFSTKKEELQELYSHIKKARISNENKAKKETTLVIQSGNKVDKRNNSLWNLGPIVSIIEGFVDRKIALPFRLPLNAPQDFVIEIEQRDDLFSEYGRYARLLLGQGHMSVIDKTHKQLHSFDITKEDLQYFCDVLRDKKFMWLQDSEEYVSGKTVITWGKNRLEKNVVIATLYSDIEKTKNLRAFPRIEKIADNLQVEVLYETTNPTTRKELFVSQTTGYLYVLDALGNRVQYNIEVTPRAIQRLLLAISKNQQPGNTANIIVDWEGSHIETQIDASSFANIEKTIYKLLPKSDLK
ncbi:hypothetical protein [Candidatus Uabimicrobium amorphum]|uniref:Uncharacterized protein n=1 Tax=Uabimicrobium amorphum TaxID=2596890 RepID=A0A5S9F2S1_UABAM|nr:hypothetical protein [Candidatus Uabimicrobium amorphum]BBM83403.1 hypothetical protein UABAM_01755 [Candidatus Uabimicrobium amorphum]